MQQFLLSTLPSPWPHIALENLNTIGNVQTQTFNTKYIFFVPADNIHLLDQFAKPFSNKVKQSAVGLMKDAGTQRENMKHKHEN